MPPGQVAAIFPVEREHLHLEGCDFPPRRHAHGSAGRLLGFKPCPGKALERLKKRLSIPTVKWYNGLETAYRHLSRGEPPHLAQRGGERGLSMHDEEDHAQP